MPASITPPLRAAVERLKHAASINGICFGWRRQVLLNLTPYQDFRVDRLLDLFHDARAHFAKADREVDTLWFGFDGIYLLALASRECSLLLLHSRSHEVDFIKKAALTMLDDCQLLLDSVLNPGEDLLAHSGTERLALNEGTEISSGQTTHLIPRS